MAFMPRPLPVILTIICVAPGATVLRTRLRTSLGDIAAFSASKAVSNGSLPPTAPAWPPQPFEVG
jgi:hypothetical protein